MVLSIRLMYPVISPGIDDWSSSGHTRSNYTSTSVTAHVIFAVQDLPDDTSSPRDH